MCDPMTGSLSDAPSVIYRIFAVCGSYLREAQMITEVEGGGECIRRWSCICDREDGQE
jgi:hypothetical protein